MNSLFANAEIFLEIDPSTYWMVGFMCCWAAYFTRKGLLNPAMALILFPLFCALAYVSYAVFLHLGFFNPKRQSDWLIYCTMSASLGSALGICLIAVVRKVFDKFIDAAQAARAARKSAAK